MIRLRRLAFMVFDCFTASTPLPFCLFEGPPHTSGHVAKLLQKACVCLRELPHPAFALVPYVYWEECVRGEASGTWGQSFCFLPYDEGLSTTTRSRSPYLHQVSF